MSRFFRASLTGVAAAWCCSLAGAQATGDYPANLAALYNERHRLVAFKDACSQALPQVRRDTQKAYEEWVDRHEDVLENLESRFLVMIRKASRDEKDYTRNYGKYQGAVMQERQVQKEAFLKLPKEDLIKECKEFPAYLRSPRSDIYNVYPEEFNAIYGKRKQ